RGAAVAVINRDVVFLGQRLTGLQIIGGAVRYLEAAANSTGINGVDAATTEREGAEIAAALRHKGRRMGVGAVDIRKREAAAGVALSGGDGTVFVHRSVAVTSHHPPLVTPCPYTTLFRSRGAAVAVINRDVVFLGQRLTGLQIIGGAVRYLE